MRAVPLFFQNGHCIIPTLSYSVRDKKMMTQSVPVKTKRPFAVTFVCIWIFLAALLDLFYGALLFASTDFVAKPPDVRIAIEQERLANALLDDQVVDAAEGILYIVLGVVQLVLGVSFWRLKQWAWVGIMSWQALSLLVDLTGMLNDDRPIESLVLSVVLVFLLNQSNVRQIFGVRSLTNQSEHASTSFRTFDSN